MTYTLERMGETRNLSCLFYVHLGTGIYANYESLQKRAETRRTEDRKYNNIVRPFSATWKPAMVRRTLPFELRDEQKRMGALAAHYWTARDLRQGRKYR